MTPKAKKPAVSWKRALAICAGVFVLAAILTIGMFGVQTVRADGRILPNVSIGTIAVGGLTPPQAEDRLRQALHAVNIAGFNFTYGQKTLTIRANENGVAPDAPVTYDIAGTIRKAFAYGHTGGALDLAQANLRAMISEVMLVPDVSIDRDAVQGMLQAQFGGFETKRIDSDLAVRMTKIAATGDASATPEVSYRYDVTVTPDSDGETFDYDAAMDTAFRAASRWQGVGITLSLAHAPAALTADRAGHMKEAALAALQQGHLSLAHKDKSWSIDAPTIARALTLKLRPDGTPYLGLRSETLDALFSTIGAVVDTDAKPTKLQLLPGGKVDQSTFEGGSVGRTLNRDATLALLEERMTDSGVSAIPVMVDTDYGHGSDQIAIDMGIQELLGYGVSNFAGSPANRRKNIANGARLLGGSVVKPGEEFSLLGALKPFTLENGYLSELVIKDSRTVPEVGGGLCQIGTTTFRATMSSGLPITQRQNHSYRVRYYEPAGTDATIYDPAPDYRFMNDTGHDVVIITRQPTPDTLRFELWGTRDGRTEAQGPVRIWNVTQPPAAKLIPTSELADGKQKCFETAHPGATTEFIYTITYPDGHVQPKTFRSVYKPWQQQCLVGTTGAPRIILARDGSLKQLPAAPGSATATLSTGIDQPVP